MKNDDDYVYSQLRKELSVITPSAITRRTQASQRSKTLAKSQIQTRSSNSYHMANPNPQPDRKEYRYKGIRDLGYSYHEKDSDPTEVVKFGKRVYHGRKLTREEYMEHHLKQMRQKMDAASSYNENQRKEALEFIAHVHDLENQEKRRMEEGRKMISDDFKECNKQIIDHKKKKQLFKEELKKKDQYNYFPFVAGDLIEQHRASLGKQLKQDLQSYLAYTQDKVSQRG